MAKVPAFLRVPPSFLKFNPLVRETLAPGTFVNDPLFTAVAPEPPFCSNEAIVVEGSIIVEVDVE